MQATDHIGQDIVRGDSGLEYRRYPIALTVNIYRDGEEVDVFTLGGDSGKNVSHADFRASVERREACLAGEHYSGDGYCSSCGEEL